MCNETWYGTLTTEAKAAIVDTQLTQDTWRWEGSGIPFKGTYTGINDTTGDPFTVNYTIYREENQHNINITRHCYALSVGEVLEYLGCTSMMNFSNTTLTKEAIWEMFYDQDTSPGESYIWLRSSCNHWDAYAMFLNGLDGNIAESCYNYYFQNRPAFKIDLSQIDFEIEGASAPVIAGGGYTVHLIIGTAWEPDWSDDTYIEFDGTRYSPASFSGDWTQIPGDFTICGGGRIFHDGVKELDAGYFNDVSEVVVSGAGVADMNQYKIGASGEWHDLLGDSDTITLTEDITLYFYSEVD